MHAEFLVIEFGMANFIFIEFQEHNYYRCRVEWKRAQPYLFLFIILNLVRVFSFLNLFSIVTMICKELKKKSMSSAFTSVLTYNPCFQLLFIIVTHFILTHASVGL